MNESTEKLLSSPTLSTQNIDSIPPINYETHPLFEQKDIVQPSFYLGPYRPEPLYAIHENEGYSSLPPDINSTNNEKFESITHQKPHSWEAEDADEFITTLNEYSIASNGSSNEPSLITVAADVHYNNKVSRPMSLNLSQTNIISSEHYQVYPNIMMQSYYDDINNPFHNVASDDEISLIKSCENLLDGSTSAKLSGLNSMTSSVMTNSTGNSFLEGDDKCFEIAQIAQNGKLLFLIIIIYITCITLYTFSKWNSDSIPTLLLLFFLDYRILTIYSEFFLVFVYSIALIYGFIRLTQS